MKGRWLLLPLLVLALAAPARASPYYLRVQAGVHHGIVMFLPGGGWVGLPDSSAADAMRSFTQPMGPRYRRITVGYRTGHSLEDTLAAYDFVRRRWPHQPVCLLGVSSGAHLALMAAVRRLDVACVVDIVGPPDLEHLNTAPASATLHQFAVDAFGPDNLAEVSPVNYTHRLSMVPVLVGASWCDIFTDLETQQRFADSIGARLVTLSTYHCIGAEQDDPAFMAQATRFTARYLQQAKRADAAKTSLHEGCGASSIRAGVPLAIQSMTSSRYRFGTDRNVRCVQNVCGPGRYGCDGRSGTHRR